MYTSIASINPLKKYRAKMDSQNSVTDISLLYSFALEFDYS